MPPHVCSGAQLMCTFGMAPSSLVVLPLNKAISSTLPSANIMDNKPMVNIMPFGMCMSIANPTVAAATSAAMGVLTPMPCIPMTTAPWAPGSPTMLLGGMPALNITSKLMCNWAGVIQIVQPGQMTKMIPDLRAGMTSGGSTRDGGGEAPTDTAADVEQLRRMGYAQELRRRMSAFSNFAISFSTICVLAGGITSLQLGLSAVGGAAAGVIWPVGVAFSLVVALCMAQVASAFPTAGGLYHWSAILGGKGWGWATAWFNLAGLVFVTAAVNVGAYGLFVNFVGPLWGIDPATLGLGHQMAGVAAIVASHALFNHFGIRVTTLLTDFSGYLIFAVTLLLTLVMVRAAPGPGLDVARLFRFENLSGPAGGGVWPAHDGLLAMALLALMWPVYTITGFDASAHTSEETVQAARNVPKGMLRSVYLSGLVGWMMVASFVVAMPAAGEAARQGTEVFAWLMKRVAPGRMGAALWVAIVVANYLCGLACMTSTSRMMYAFARDGGLPWSRAISRVSPRRRTPVIAIWTTAGLALASTAYAPVYSTLTAACVVFLYLSYVMPTIVGLRALGRTWTRMGPFDLGRRVYRALGVVAIAGVALLVWIGVQPPNEKVLWVTAAMTALLLGAWWLRVRRSFRGPPLPTTIGAPPPPSSSSGGG